MPDFLSCNHGEAQIALCLGMQMGLEIKPELECLHLSSSATPLAKEGNMRSRKYTVLVPRSLASLNVYLLLNLKLQQESRVPKE